ncbi:MAG: hypothetical protein ACRDHZ_02100, partial [Ktedonobacteraceae bacterium]
MIFKPKMPIYEVIPGILQRFAWVPARLLLGYFCHLEIKGPENLTSLNTNVIIASNHSSELD